MIIFWPINVVCSMECWRSLLMRHKSRAGPLATLRDGSQKPESNWKKHNISGLAWIHLTTNLITQLIERCFLDCSHHFMRSKKLFSNLAKNLAKKRSYGGRLNSRRSKGTHFFGFFTT